MLRSSVHKTMNTLLILPEYRNFDIYWFDLEGYPSGQYFFLAKPTFLTMLSPFLNGNNELKVGVFFASWSRMFPCEELALCVSCDQDKNTSYETVMFLGIGQDKAIPSFATCNQRYDMVQFASLISSHVDNKLRGIPNLPVGCQHEWVDCGFNFTNEVCKHCNTPKSKT